MREKFSCLSSHISPLKTFPVFIVASIFPCNSCPMNGVFFDFEKIFFSVKIHVLFGANANYEIWQSQIKHLKQKNIQNLHSKFLEVAVAFEVEVKNYSSPHLFYDHRLLLQIDFLYVGWYAHHQNKGRVHPND